MGVFPFVEGFMVNWISNFFNKNIYFLIKFCSVKSLSLENLDLFSELNCKRGEFIMNCRKNVKDLDIDEKNAFIAAVLKLKNETPSQLSDDQYNLMLDRVENNFDLDTRNGIVRPDNRYDDYVLLHVTVAGINGAHQMPAFLPWHRRYLEYFEADLQAASENPNLTIPYWDWSDLASIPFTADFLGGDGDEADDKVTTGPFAFDTGEWTLNILIGTENNNTGDRAPYLRRSLGAGTASTSGLIRETLAVTPYDKAPWIPGDNDPNYDNNDAFRNRLEGWFRRNLPGTANDINPPQLHNNGHVWTGGTMEPATSPNDPVFFLNHAMVDMLWAVWQQKHPAEPYLPPPGTPDPFVNLSLDGHRSNENMAMFQGGITFAAPATPNSVLDWRNPAAPATSYAYQTDLPVVDLLTPSINFGNVPANTTAYKPIQFSVETCRPVKFRISNLVGNNFSDPYAPVPAIVEVPTGNGPSTGDVYIAYQAVGGAGPEQVGACQVQAFIDDEEGYYIDPADPSAPEYPLGTWNVNFSATPVERENTAIAMVLDRSGSMSLSAGGSATRFQLLENAVQVISDIMQETDGLGMIYYDQNVNRVFDILPMTPVSGQSELANAINNAALEPSGGSTAIGSGMIEGADVLNDEIAKAGTPYERFAMIVMTDGNENVEPYVNHPDVANEISGFSSNVYAVGLGKQGDVSDATLGSIANYMLVTGEMNAQEQLFRLTKYFVQILAGATKMDIVVDPEGNLVAGIEHRIPFDVCEADIYFDVIALSPFAPFINMVLETPGGVVIDLSNLGPNVTYHLNKNDAFYRVNLPALPGKPDVSHAGRWHAILKLTDKLNDKIALAQFEQMRSTDTDAKRRTLPYSVLVQSYSDIHLKVDIERTSKLAGSPLQLYANLTQYNVALANRAFVSVEVSEPSGSVRKVELQEYEPGKFKGTYATTTSGIYRCRFLAKGSSFSGHRFTREELRTASAYRDLPQIPVPETGKDDGKDVLCKLIACWLKDESIRNWLHRNKIDSKNLLKCLDAYCRSGAKTFSPADIDRIPKDKIPGLLKKVIAHRGDFAQFLSVSTKEKELAKEVKLSVGSKNIDLKPMAPKSQYCVQTSRPKKSLSRKKKSRKRK